MKDAVFAGNKKTSKLVTKLDSIYDLDQSIREQCKQIATNYYSVCKDTILHIDSLYLIKLVSVIDQYGFPTDKDYDNSIPGHMPNFLWVICHNKTQINQIIIPALEDAVLHNSLHPQLFSFIRGGNNETYQYQEFGLGYSIELNGDLYVFNLKDETIKGKINSNREKYMLDDLDSYNEKIKFQYFNPEFKLLYSIMFSSIQMDKETTAMLSEKWKDAKVTEYNIR